MEISSRGTRSWRSFGRVWSRAPMSRWRYRFSAEPSTTAGPREASSKRSPGAATALLTTRSRARAIRLSPQDPFIWAAGLVASWMPFPSRAHRSGDRFLQKGSRCQPSERARSMACGGPRPKWRSGRGQGDIVRVAQIPPKARLARARARKLALPGPPAVLGAARENGGSGSAQGRHAGGMNALARPE